MNKEIQISTCPKCGSETFEYEEKRWQCVKCNRKFTYIVRKPPDKPPEDKETHGNKLDNIGVVIAIIIGLLLLMIFLALWTIS